LSDEEVNKQPFSNCTIKAIASETAPLVLKSSLKKVSMFSSDYNSLAKKDCHVQILDSVTIINPREDDKKMSIKKSAMYGIRAIRKSLSTNSVKNAGKTNSLPPPPKPEGNLIIHNK